MVVLLYTVVVVVTVLYVFNAAVECTLFYIL
jgi:hypothetical protein